MNDVVIPGFMSEPYQQKLIQLITNESWLMDALRTVRSLRLPDWYVAAGAIRNTVWNVLHNYSSALNQNDIDVVYFDASDMEGRQEKELELALMQKCPELRWEVVNQARAHLFSNRPIVHSSCESIAYWSETPTCVGARMEDNDALVICAPHGLDDLLNLIVRPIPPPYQDLELYRNRIEQKAWDRTWPKLRIIPAL